MDLSKAAARQKITFERYYKASPAEVWELWTTKEGIEEWWGPDGFAVTVRRIELTVGGVLDYDMTAVAGPQMEFMKKAGMPLSNHHVGTFTVVEPERRLGFSLPADFIPGVEPYPVETLVEIFPMPEGVRLLVTIDPMHDAHWTDMAVKGFELELGRLERVLEARANAGKAG